MYFFKSTYIVAKRYWYVTLVILLLVLSSLFTTFHTNNYEFVASGKERQCDSTGGETATCYYVVFGQNGEVFTNQDSVLQGKFNSASIQARVIVGKRYRTKASGFRVPFLSMKPNITTLEEI